MIELEGLRSLFPLSYIYIKQENWGSLFTYSF